MFFNENGSLECAFGELAFGIPLGVLGSSSLLLFHAYEHFRKEEAFKFLPRLAVFANSYGAVET